jgi:hypothetical protein
MSTYLLPDVIAEKCVGFDIQMVGNVMSNTSPLNNVTRTAEFPGDLYSIRVEFAPMFHHEFVAHEVFWNRLRRNAHRFQIWRLVNRGVPRGTLRGSPTVRTAAVRGANFLNITGDVGGTLIPGDMLGVTLDNAVVQPVQVAVASGAGSTLTVELVAPLRRAANQNALIYWYRPLITCVLTAPPFPSYRSVVSEGYTIEAIEVPT